MAVVQLGRGKQKRVAAGHPWVFRNEVLEIRGSFQPGDIVDVVDHRGKHLGRGYINPASQILVRILTEREETIDREFFRRRLMAAWEHRRRFLSDTGACRVVFAEADQLPAMIVDKFGDVLVMQTLALGIDRWKEDIADLLMEIIEPKGIFERNDVPVRELEGLRQHKGFLRGEFDPRIEIRENDLKILVDIENGQKTGYFLDQRDNRRAVRPLSAGARVLDAFCHTGGFALNAAAGGAREVVAFDISGEAVYAARDNVRRNGFEALCQVREANAFDLLRELERDKERFNLVVLDPPAFAKNRAALEGATRGYKEINLRAMKLIPEGGFLVTCSCSYHMSADLFLAVVQDAARDAHRRLRLLENRTQGLDHPIMLGADESYYLKCLVLQVL